MKLIIDGYNLIFADQRLPVSPHSLERARNELIWLLTHYNMKKSHQIVVVFDGDDRFNWLCGRYCIPMPGCTKRSSARIDVRYSAGDSSADDMIKDLVAGCARPSSSKRSRRHVSDVNVITSDRSLARTVGKRGVTTTNCREFLKDLRGTFDEPVSDFAVPEEKAKGLSSQQVDGWMKVFGLDQDRS